MSEETLVLVSLKIDADTGYKKICPYTRDVQVVEHQCGTWAFFNIAELHVRHCETVTVGFSILSIGSLTLTQAVYFFPICVYGLSLLAMTRCVCYSICEIAYDDSTSQQQPVASSLDLLRGSWSFKRQHCMTHMEIVRVVHRTYATHETGCRSATSTGSPHIRAKGQ